jgi:PIN domain nuclease of toxin-antitoxin system
MDLLLDTHVFLWYLQGYPSLSLEARELLEATENNLYLSIVSFWEIAIKLGLGKLELEYSFQNLPDVSRQLGIKILPISFEHTERYVDLPLHHRDPFDRMLVAQAIQHSYPLVSRDAMFDAYAIQRLWA